MEMLINGIMKYGGKKERLEAKVFGGGKIYDSPNDIGAKNAAWALDYLENEGLPLLKADVGDLCPRKIYFFTDSGKVLMKKLDRLDSKSIENEEKQYQSKLEQVQVKSDVTLF